jgi:hypothetical protein
MLFWNRSFNSKEGNACAKKPSKHSIELQAEASLCTLQALDPLSQKVKKETSVSKSSW